MTRFSLVLFAVALTLGTTPAYAKAKKKSATTTAPAEDTEQPGEAKPAADEKPAAQANDEEKPKVMLDLGQEAPKTDSLGHVHFASPNGEGLGRVTVNAPAAQKVKVFLEGRYFGTAPITIYSVPKGDYIIEALPENGKQVSKPVTVSEGENTTVDLSGPKANNGGGGDSMMTTSAMTPGRKTLMWGFLIGAGVGLVVGTTFGILELQAENDYQHTPSNNQAQLDSIQQKGQRDANIADIGWGVAGVGLLGAAICALPLLFGPSEKGAPSGASSAMVVAPVAGHGMTGGALMLRF
ncbi:MAG TPA: PEGA domain-containing protein [Polyangia bacterium]|nr:PEGA domain-containing protein [Polyangia bacterium]